MWYTEMCMYYLIQYEIIATKIINTQKVLSLFIHKSE